MHMHYNYSYTFQTEQAAGFKSTNHNKWPWDMHVWRVALCIEQIISKAYLSQLN